MAASFKKDQEQGARTRNAVPSEARDVPLMLIIDQYYVEGNGQLREIFAKFYVRKVELEEGLKFISEGNSPEQRNARTRQLFAHLIATSHK